MKSPVLIFIFSFTCFLSCNAQEKHHTNTDNNPILELSFYSDSLLNEQFDEQKDPGVAISIIYEGEVQIRKTKGLKNLEDSTLISLDTPFYIASAAKPFTAQLISLLIKKGKIKPDDNIGGILADLPEYMKGIKIKNLLNHSSGITDYYQYITWREPVIDNEYVISLLSERTDSLLFKPGEKFDYSNSNYIILAELAEEISQKPYFQLLKDEIFDVLNMGNSYVYTGIENIDSVATGYRYVNDEFLINDYRRIEIQKGVIGSYNLRTRGAGGIFTTQPDLEKWLINFRENYNLNTLNESRIAVELKQYKNLYDVSYNYGWYIGKINQKLIFWHSGEFAGYRALVLFIPELDFGLVILSNNGKFDAENFGLRAANKFVEIAK